MEPYFTQLACAFVRGRLKRPNPTLENGIAAGLRLHKFKSNAALPRVRRVLGIPHGLTSIDWSERRTIDLDAARRGGIVRLSAARMDAQRPAFRPKSFDVDPQAALDGMIAVARRFVLISVPSVPDDNPEHLHLFSVAQLHEMSARAGGARITVEHVLNHRIALIRVPA